MKKLPFLRLLFAAVPALGLFGVATSAHAQALALIANGSFEADAQGITSGSPPAVIDNSTFTDFRFFNVSNPTIGFGATIIAGGTTGNNAMRLDVNNNSATPAANGSYGLDIYNNQIAITPNTAYEFTFDAAYIAGTSELTVTVAEFTSTGAFAGEQTVDNISLSSGTAMTPDTSYHNYTVAFTPTVSSAATVDLTFTPSASISTSSALSIDNIEFGQVPEPGTVSMLAFAAGVAGFCFLRKRASKLAAV